MPINPEIALQVRQPEFHDPLQSYAKIAGVRNMITQNALHQQQIATSQEALKSHQLANAETVRSQADTANFADAFTKAGGDFQKAIPVAIAAGVRPSHIAKMTDEYNKQVEQVAKTDKEKVGAAEAATDYLHENLSGIAAITDPAQQQMAWDAKNQDAVKAGVIKAPLPYPGADGVNDALLKVQTQKSLFAAAAEKRKVDEEARKLAKAPAELTKAEQEAITATQKATGTEPIQPQQAATLAQTKFNEGEMRKIQQRNADTAAGHLAETRRINAMEYGPGMIDSWVENLKDNPDSVKELPGKLRSVVGQRFKEATGLPLPTPLTGGTKTSETAARNALDGIDFIRKAVQNPEIASQIGPIMGRLGNAEQAIGTAVGLSPEAEKLAQELRTRMRYFVFQEGKAILGGRLPQNLMHSLEGGSANVKMDPRMLEGALSGAEGSAQSILENADKERFGGKSRTPEMRGMKAATPAAQVIRFKSGATNYNIPADQAADFLKDHPNAVKQ